MLPKSEAITKISALSKNRNSELLLEMMTCYEADSLFDITKEQANEWLDKIELNEWIKEKEGHSLDPTTIMLLEELEESKRKNIEKIKLITKEGTSSRRA